MIEPVMYVAIGFLVACMLIIGFIPIVHARAVRLTNRRLEAATPMSMGEIQADKDQLRAEFAMSTRRLEMSVEQMKAKTTGQLAEIGKKSESVGRLTLELGEKAAALVAFEAREKLLNDELRETKDQRDQKAVALQETEHRLTEIRSEIAAVTTGRNESSLMVDSQRVDLVTLRAQIEVLKGQTDSHDTETRDLHKRLAVETTNAATMRQQLGDEIAKSETFAGRVAELESHVAAQTTEAEVLGRRVQELLARLDEQRRSLTERDYASDALRNEATLAQQAALDLRAELSEAEKRRHSSTETLQTQRTVLENQLAQSHEERARLQEQIASMKREVEATWASERMENAVLRERINDVAAEVARLTSVLEGPGSAIDSLLAADNGRTASIPLAPAAGADHSFGAKAANGDAGRGSLADRIRALQSRASQVPHPSGV